MIKIIKIFENHSKLNEINTATAIYPTSLGNIEIKYTEDAIVSIKKILDKDTPAKSNPSILSDNLFCQLDEYLNGKRLEFDIPIALAGTAFQTSVWQELINIPYGETRSYKDIAQAIGSPKACRAVGMANNKNQLQIVVPCHRVVGKSGKLVGYAGGLNMKKQLLELEKTNKSDKNKEGIPD